MNNRSKVLNNIPEIKFNTQIKEVLKSCVQCSKLKIDNSQYIDGVCNKCSKIITIYKRYQKSNLPIEFWPLKMDKDFNGDPRLLEKYKEYISDIKKSYNDGRSICFASGHGRGKTMTITNILKVACIKGYECLYTDLSGIVSALISAPYEERYAANKELISVDFLAIDEADIRFFNQSASSNELFGKTFESIIRNRLQNKLPTILATNSPNIKEMFSSFFKDSIDSLLNKIPVFVILGEDYRKTK